MMVSPREDRPLPPADAPAAFPAEGRLLAVDWGTKRIGLAVSDPTQTIAQPLATITRRAGRRFPMGQLRQHLSSHRPVGVVVGLPLDERGAEGASAEDARAVGALIADKSGLPVAFWDERMTTARLVREHRSLNEGRAPDPERRDELAATILLQTYLDSRRR